MSLAVPTPAVADAPMDHTLAIGGGAHVGTVDLVVGAVAFLLAAVAVAGVFMAARLYGGEVGESLTYVGGGVTVFSLERFWYAFYAVGFVPETPFDGAGGATAVSLRNLLLLGAATLLAIGFLKLERTMSRRLG